jgi:hypothetical protein
VPNRNIYEDILNFGYKPLILDSEYTVRTGVRSGTGDTLTDNIKRGSKRGLPPRILPFHPLFVPNRECQPKKYSYFRPYLDYVNRNGLAVNRTNCQTGPRRKRSNRCQSDRLQSVEITVNCCLHWYDERLDVYSDIDLTLGTASVISNLEKIPDIKETTHVHYTAPSKPLCEIRHDVS